MTTSPQHPAAWPAEQLLRQCRLQRTRRSGPGGQHRNKVETAVILTHLPTAIMAEASERRSPIENQAQAVFRLRLNLALQVRCPAGERPSSLWSSRCVAGRLLVNAHHEDFPAMLAEALDYLEAEAQDIAAAAGRLHCTMSQLVKLFRKEPRAMSAINAARARDGLPRLR